jgi:hypothetical protein
VDIVLNDAGIRQTISLLTRTPGPSNIKVYQRPLNDRSSITNLTTTVVADVTAQGARTANRVTVQLQYLGVFLGYYVAGELTHAPGPDGALLSISVCSKSAALTGTAGCYPIDERLLTLAQDDGQPIPRRDLGYEASLFEVPWNFTRGKATMSGTAVLPNGMKLTIVHPVTFEVALP